MPATAPNEPTRLSKIVAEMAGCSRREAELFIEGGWVRVNGQVVDIPGAKVLNEKVTLDEKAVAEPIADVTIVLYKPAGFETWTDGRKPAMQLVAPRNQSSADKSGIRPARQHFQQECLTDLEPAATGLVIYSQDFKVRRKLTEDAGVIEHEVIVEVAGEVSDKQLDRLNRAPVIDGRAMAPAKVSISQQTDTHTGLRFATKGHWPGRIAQMVEGEGLRLTGMKRIRIGRISLAGLQPGEWRFLTPHERV